MPRTLNLDAARRARLARKGETIPVIFKGETIAEIVPELPMRALAPLLDLAELDLPLILRQGMDVYKSTGSEAKAAEAMLDMAINVFFQHPKLPVQLVEAVREIGRRILTPEGFDRFMALEPTVPDVLELARGLASVFGVGLGESRPSTTGSPGGTTSPRTSTTTTTSTSPESGTTPGTPGSSESDGSSPSPSVSPLPL